MITANEQKKTLVARLLDEKHINLDEAFMILDDSAPIQYITPVIQMPYVAPYVYPQPQLPWYEVGKPYCGGIPGSTCTDPLVHSMVSDINYYAVSDVLSLDSYVRKSDNYLN